MASSESKFLAETSGDVPRMKEQAGAATDERQDELRTTSNGGFHLGGPRGQRLVPSDAHRRKELDNRGGTARQRGGVTWWLNEVISQTRISRNMFVYIESK